MNFLAILGSLLQIEGEPLSMGPVLSGQLLTPRQRRAITTPADNRSAVSEDED